MFALNTILLDARIRKICTGDYSIRAVLAIEGNELSEGQVADIIDGKTVMAPLPQVQEVKNAIATYDMYDSLNPFSVMDLLRAHGAMMMALADDAGKFRKGGVGVFSDRSLVHMAPPAERVPQLIDDLFEWLTKADDHLLIRSCVFHCEFEFIHPFSDGNGRIGRLWQSLILGRLNPLFAHLPIENMVFANQQEYYDAIATSTRVADSGPFINFMLGEILKTLKSHQGEELNKVPNKVPDKVPNKSELSVLALLKKDGGLTMMQLAKKMHLSESGIKKILASLKSLGLIVRIGSNKTGYWQVNEAAPHSISHKSSY